MQWEIQFQRDQPSTHEFVKRVIEFISDSGFEFGSGPYPKRFSIIGPSSSTDINQINGDDWEGGIGSVLSKFNKHDPTSTSLTIYFARPEEPYVPFACAIIPRPDATLVSFQTHDADITTESAMNMFINLCKDFFSSFDFSFGGYTDEHNPQIPQSIDEFLEEEFRRIVFLSASAASRLDWEHPDSRSPEEVQELSNGGVMMDFHD